MGFSAIYSRGNLVGPKTEESSSLSLCRFHDSILPCCSDDYIFNHVYDANQENRRHTLKWGILPPEHKPTLQALPVTWLEIVGGSLFSTNLRWLSTKLWVCSHNFNPRVTSKWLRSTWTKDRLSANRIVLYIAKISFRFMRLSLQFSSHLSYLQLRMLEFTTHFGGLRLDPWPLTSSGCVLFWITYPQFLGHGIFQRCCSKINFHGSLIRVYFGSYLFHRPPPRPILAAWSWLPDSWSQYTVKSILTL